MKQFRSVILITFVILMVSISSLVCFEKYSINFNDEVNNNNLVILFHDPNPGHD